MTRARSDRDSSSPRTGTARGKKTRVGIARFVAIPRCRSSDVGRNSLADHVDPLAGGMCIAVPGKLQYPLRGVDAHEESSMPWPRPISFSFCAGEITSAVTEDSRYVALLVARPVI